MEDLPIAALIEIFKYGNVNALSRTCKSLNSVFNNIKYHLLENCAGIFTIPALFSTDDEKIIRILYDNIPEKYFDRFMLMYGKFKFVRQYEIGGKLDSCDLELENQTAKVIFYLLPHVEDTVFLISNLIKNGRQQLAWKIFKATGEINGILLGACKMSDLDMAKWAVRCGADMIELAIYASVVEGSVEITDYLLDKNPNLINNALHGAAHTENTDLIDEYISRGATDLNNALLLATKNNKAKSCTHLIKCGATNIDECSRLAFMMGNLRILHVFNAIKIKIEFEVGEDKVKIVFDD